MWPVSRDHLDLVDIVATKCDGLANITDGPKVEYLVSMLVCTEFNHLTIFCSVECVALTLLSLLC